MRIGITVRGGRSQHFWRDGASQYAVFLAGAFMRLPFVRAVVLIDVGGKSRLPRVATAVAPGLRIVTQQQASGEIDVIVELADGLDRAWLERMRSRNCKVIGCCSESPYEAVPAASVSVRAPERDRYDEIWLLPKDRPTLPLMRALYCCPVRVVPLLWLPAFVERRIAALEHSGVHYGYDATRTTRETGAAGWRIAAIEPDLPAASKPGIPLLACEDAYRTDRNALSVLHVLNALRVNDRAKRTLLANTFDLVRDHRTMFHGTYDLVDFVGKHADAVFAHQRNGGEAYCYLDVLYGGYPLIHNAPWLLEAGYYYPGDDVRQGARVLLAAVRGHDAAPGAYHARSRALFDALDPFSDTNLAAYAEALSSLGPV